METGVGKKLDTVREAKRDWNKSNNFAEMNLFVETAMLPSIIKKVLSFSLFSNPLTKFKLLI